MKLYKDKYLSGLAILAALVSIVIYYITKAPTVSFWDCGEFIASAYIMGIPHPPGYPMYVIIGRLFTLLPIASDIAVRVNLLSVVGGAASVWLAFWLILRIIIGKGDKPGGFAGLGLGIGAFSGALIMGFSRTFWSNAVEAEVYTLSMFLMLLINYLALLWSHGDGYRKRDNIIILISYLAWLSLGIHMTTFIIIIPSILYLTWIDFKETGLRRWPVWAVMSLFVLYAVPLQSDIMWFLGFDISRYELESFILIFLLAFVGILFMSLVLWLKKSENLKAWLLALSIMIAAVLGYSSQAYIPIRAAQKPAINENAPSDWSSFKGFLERKQYGQESMFRRMFQRRGSWVNQFITHPRFGFLGILSLQYASPDAKIVLYESREDGGGDFSVSFPMIYILIFGLLGVFESIRRSPPEGIYVILTTLLCTAGLVIYMNFSDGMYASLKAPIAEVRNRDYFYTPGFMYYALLIGVGMASVLRIIGKTADTSLSARRLSRIWFGLACAVVLAMACHTAAANFEPNDRRGNYLPVDYARNILDSCDKDAVIFTNGDNDTFPLWYIQEVEGYRRDIRVANLSLLNTSWYIRQLKYQKNLPITLTNDAIDSLRAFRISNSDRIVRIQDQMLQHIITENQSSGWKIPLYFAITVPGENRLGMEDHMVMEGMAYRLVETSGEERVNTDVGMKIFRNQANFRSIADRSVGKDENDRKLIMNYTVAIFQIADDYIERGILDSAMMAVDIGIELYPVDRPWQIDAYKARIWAVRGRFDQVSAIAERSSEGEKILLSASQDLIKYSEFDKARELLIATLKRYPSSLTAFNNLAAVYYQDGDSEAFDDLAEKFRTENSGDPIIVASMEQIVSRLKQLPRYSARKQ